MKHSKIAKAIAGGQVTEKLASEVLTRFEDYLTNELKNNNKVILTLLGTFKKSKGRRVFHNGIINKKEELNFVQVSFSANARIKGSI